VVGKDENVQDVFFLAGPRKEWHTSQHQEGKRESDGTTGLNASWSSLRTNQRNEFLVLASVCGIAGEK